MSANTSKGKPASNGAPGHAPGGGNGIEVELDGARVFVGRGGAQWTGARSRVVLMHGAGMDHTVWVLLGRWLARHGHDVVIPDLPGHGRSQGTPLASIEAMADWLSRLLGKLDEAEVVPASETTDKPSLTLVGHSMGSLIATQAITSMKPDRVILLGAGYPMRVGPPLLQAAENNDPVAADMIAAFGHAYASLLGHNPLPGIPVANFARVLLLSAQPGVLHADLNACDRYTVPEDVLSGIRGSANTSVYLIAGDQDRMTPAKATKALAELLGGDIHWLPGSGHMMMTEQPEQTLAAVRQALA